MKDSHLSDFNGASFAWKEIVARKTNKTAKKRAKRQRNNIMAKERQLKLRRAMLIAQLFRTAARQHLNIIVTQLRLGQCHSCGLGHFLVDIAQ